MGPVPRGEGDMGPMPRWRPRRAAWLLTHAGLRSAEVPLLRSLGCEVWVQKAFPDGPGFRSCSAGRGWDDGLTLPADVLAELNAFDFYYNPMPPRIAELLNEHFEFVIIDPYPVKTREVLAHFRGPVLIRAFGMEHPLSYSEVYFADYCSGATRAMRQHFGRFWFGAFYPEVIPHENEFFRRRAFHLPVTLPEAAWRREGTWEGGDGRVFFVCPSINEHISCQAIYDEFKRHFGGLPHVIVGRQDSPVADPNVVGFLPDEQYARLYRRAQVMYYHSREPRHLHYHPVEAMASGMPVVYLRGGLLEKYDTGTQAGACDDEAEARGKLLRVLGGDRGLIAAIRESQRTVVDKWRPGVVREAWRLWLDLFAPDEGGKKPALELWDNSPPHPRRDDLVLFPYLDPDVHPLFVFLHRAYRFTCRYFKEATRQRTLLPRGLRSVDAVRKALARWFGPAQNKAA